MRSIGFDESISQRRFSLLPQSSKAFYEQTLLVVYFASKASSECHASCQTFFFCLVPPSTKPIQASNSNFWDIPACDPPRSHLPLSNVKWSILCHRKTWGEVSCNKIIVKFTRIGRKPFSNTFHFVFRYRSGIIHEYQGGFETSKV